MKEREKERFDFEDFETHAISKLMQGGRLGAKDGVLSEVAVLDSPPLWVGQAPRV